MSGMRLRSIRYKDGRAPVHVLHNSNENPVGAPENWRGVLQRHARMISEAAPEAKLDGFLVVGLFDDGTRSLGYRVSDRIPRELLPSYIAEILRSDICTEHWAEKVFDDRFVWVDK